MGGEWGGGMFPLHGTQKGKIRNSTFTISKFEHSYHESR
jgi:hypothetical protein